MGRRRGPPWAARDHLGAHGLVDLRNVRPGALETGGWVTHASQVTPAAFARAGSPKPQYVAVQPLRGAARSVVEHLLLLRVYRLLTYSRFAGLLRHVGMIGALQSDCYLHAAFFIRPHEVGEENEILLAAPTRSSFPKNAFSFSPVNEGR